MVEAVRRGLARRIYQRLSDQEQQEIRSGSIFVWNEDETQIKRWTDGKFWSNSRMKGRFFLYKELANSKKVIQVAKQQGTMMDQSERDFLRKKTISVRTAQRQKYHLVNYYYDSDVKNGTLERPSQCLEFKRLHVEPGFYHTGLDSTPLMITNHEEIKYNSLPFLPKPNIVLSIAQHPEDFRAIDLLNRHMSF